MTAVEVAGAELHHHYRVGRWVPHVSIATHAQGTRLASVVRMVSDLLPLTLQVDRAALVDSSTGETWPLPHLL